MELYNKIYGAPIFDVYGDEEPSLAVLRATMKKEFFRLQEELREEMKKMVEYWEDQAATWRKKMETLKKLNRPAKRIEVTTTVEILENSRCLSRKRRHARTVTTKRHNHTSQTRKKKGSRSNFSNFGYGVISTQPRENDKLSRLPSPRWTFQVLFHVLFSCAKEVMSLTDRTGTDEKRPFDRGKVMLMGKPGLVSNLEDKVLWRVEY